MWVPVPSYRFAVTNRDLAKFGDTILNRREPSMSEPKSIDSAFIGLRYTKVTRFGEESWKFDFEGRTVLQDYCPWRMVTAAGTALGNPDHEQRFGLPKP